MTAKTTEHAWDFQREMPHVHPRPDMVSVLPESPHPLVTALEELLTRFRWHFDAFREWCKRFRMTQQKHRIDPDFNPEDDNIRALVRAIERLVARPPTNNYHAGSDGHELKKWIASLGLTLTAAFIIGGWTLSNQVAALTAKVEERMKAQDDRIRRIEDSQLYERRQP